MTQRVTHVRPARGPFTHFKVNGVEKTRDTCVNEIERGFDYQTHPALGIASPIHIINVNNKKYLRTDRNKTPEDNLGSLPCF